MLLQTLIKRATATAATRPSTSTRCLGSLATATKSSQQAAPPSPTAATKQKTTTEYETVVEFHEHCKSGSDGEAAELKVTAYGKSTTKPDEEMLIAEEESKKLGHTSNPLDVSSANPLFSEVRDSSLEGSLRDERVQSLGTMKGVTVKQGQCKKYG